MARLTRRGFIQASSALAAAPALTAIAARAQGPAAPDIGNLRLEKDIVFGKGGTMDLTLDVYQPPAGVTSKLSDRNAPAWEGPGLVSVLQLIGREYRAHLSVADMAKRAGMSVPAKF